VETSSDFSEFGGIYELTVPGRILLMNAMFWLWLN
jgi:hypothetical protein